MYSDYLTWDEDQSDRMDEQALGETAYMIKMHVSEKIMQDGKNPESFEWTATYSEGERRVTVEAKERFQ